MVTSMEVFAFVLELVLVAVALVHGATALADAAPAKPVLVHLALQPLLVTFSDVLVAFLCQFHQVVAAVQVFEAWAVPGASHSIPTYVDARAYASPMNYQELDCQVEVVAVQSALKLPPLPLVTEPNPEP